MNRDLYRELWGFRFQKMLKLEQRSVEEYGSLLNECREKHKSDLIEAHLKRLIHDESRHVQLVKELLTILSRQS